jgi:hypothetical protein
MGVHAVIEPTSATNLLGGLGSKSGLLGFGSEQLGLLGVGLRRKKKVRQERQKWYEG